jgi:hypothetical protein
MKKPSIYSITWAFLIAVLVPLSAHASDFLFSYTFDTGDYVTGSFTGDLQGNIISNLSNVSVSLDGTIFPTNNISVSSWSDTNFWVSGGAIASLDGTQNNFNFRSFDNVATYDFLAIPFFSAVTNNAQAYISLAFNNYPVDVVGYNAQHWSVTAVPVPEPETYAMMLAGLGMLGFAARRRKQQAA